MFFAPFCTFNNSFFFLRRSTLLPWNFFISLNNFWDYKFREINGTLEFSKNPKSKTELQKIFTSYLAIASMIPNAIFVILNASFGQRFKTEKRITISITMVILLFGIGMISQKKSQITIFGHKHKIKNFIKNNEFLIKITLEIINHFE